MKVCFLAGTLGRGGAERQLFFMLRALQLGGVETRLLCLTKGEAFEADVRKLGIDVEWVGFSRNRLLRLRKIINAVRKQQTDILQSSHFYTNIYAAAAGRLLGLPNIGAIRNDVNSEVVANRAFGKMQLRLPKHLIANSDIAVKRAVSLGVVREHIDFLPNVVELGAAAPVAQEAEKKTINIIFVGRLVPQKRPYPFTRLAIQLRRELPGTDLKFQIIGEGPLRSDLESVRDSFGLSRNELSFLGECSDMAPVYRNADILVLTSEYEGTPNVILEAMSFGIPVVATRVGGVSEVLTPEAGILVDPLDFKELEAATTKLIQDPELRRVMGRNGRDHVAKNYSFENLQARLISIYKKLLGEGQSR